MRYPDPKAIRLRQQGILSPFPVSPRGKPGRGWFPPRRDTSRASEQRCHDPCTGSPRKRDFKALR
jgi:hypothetical protein